MLAIADERRSMESGISGRKIDRAIYAMEFEKLLNSFHDVTVLEVPPTATSAVRPISLYSQDASATDE